MKTTVIAMASLLAAAGAQAQSVTIYGLIDAGVEYLDHVGPSNSREIRVPSLTGQQPSRLGFRGAEDLGGGLKAVFTIESGFAPDQGTLNQGGRMWGRQAFVGLSSPYGTFTAGRQYTMTLWSLLDADVIGPGAFALPALDIYYANPRTDNTLAYRGTFSGVTLGATYSRGRDAVGGCAGEGTGCTGWSLLARYDTPNWGMALSSDTARGGGTGAAGAPLVVMAGFAIPNGFANPHDKDTRSQVNGYVKFAGAKVGGGLFHRKVDTANDANDFQTNLAYLGASYPFTDTFTVDGQVLRITNDRYDADATMFVLRGNYNLSRRTALYVTAGRMNNQGSRSYSVSSSTVVPSLPAPGTDQTGLMTGIRHSF